MRLKSLLLAAAAAASVPAFAAGTLYQQDFESGSTGVGGAGGVVGSQGYSGYGFATQLWQNGSASASTDVSFSAGAGASAAVLNVSLAIIDSWDGPGSWPHGDYLNIRLDGSLIFRATFENYSGTGATTAPGLTTLAYNPHLGFSGYPDAAYALTLDLGNLAAGSHTLSFFADGSGWQAGSDESFGIDNILVTAAVPEPESYALLLVGLAGVGIAARRRRQG